MTVGDTVNLTDLTDPMPFFGNLRMRITLPCGCILSHTVMADTLQPKDPGDFLRLGAEMLHQWFHKHRAAHMCDKVRPTRKTNPNGRRAK